MAARKNSKKPAKQAARTTTKRSTAKRSARTTARRTARAPKRTTRPTASARAPARTTAAPAVRKVRPGFIAHTELASADPAATKAWCQEVLGWKFGEPMPIPGGLYHMWSFGDNMGGGIRANNPPETPGSIPYCEVKDIKAAYAKAIGAGAHEMMPPTEVAGGMGWIAIVAAPGGPAVGFWSTK